MSLSKEPLTHPDMVYSISSSIEEFPFMEPLSLTQAQLLHSTLNEVKRSLNLPFGSSLGHLPINEIIGIYLAHAWMKAKLVIQHHSFSEKTAASFMAAVESLIDQKIEQIFAQRQQYIFHQDKNRANPKLSTFSRSQIETAMRQLTAVMDIPASQFHQNYLNLIQIFHDRFLKASRKINYLRPSDIPCSPADKLTTPPAEKLFESLMDQLIKDWNQFVQRLAQIDAAYCIILRK
ncbi:MAG TPA: hypothetical protein PLC07_10345 [Bacillota bacterium]|nr:hypothetical protein [Bacillota bacterium]